MIEYPSYVGQIRNKFGMTVIFVDIHRNSTENEALKVCHHWLQWEQNLLTSSHMAKFSDLPAGCHGKYCA